MERREFLKATTLAVGAAVAGPLLLTSRKSVAQDAPGVMGAGEHLYEWEGAWAKLPKSKAFGFTQGVCEDRQGRILIFNNSKDAIMVFDPEGQFMESWGAEYEDAAHGIHRTVEEGVEFLYLSLPQQHRIVKTTIAGELVWERGYPQEAGVYGSGNEYAPTNIAVAPNGSFYVGDGYGRNYVHQYTKDAEWVRTWGGTGNDFAKFRQPHGIWVDTRGEHPKVVVADRGNRRLVDFNLKGELKRPWKWQVHTPCHFDQRGDYLLVPELWGRVTILDKDNQVYARLGEYIGAPNLPDYPNIAHELRLPGKFSSPHACIWDREGNIFCAEWIDDGRVTKLRRIT